MTAVVVNPRAGGGRAGARFFRAWEKLGFAVSAQVLVPQTLEELERAVRELVAQGVSRLVAVGGDGTFHRVVNAAMGVGAGELPVLGLVPAGTGSDLARALRLPRSLPAALRLAFTAPPRRCDLGELVTPTGVVFFCNVASFGVSGLVDQRVNANPERGRWSFLLATLAAVREYRPVRCRVLVDGVQLYQGPVLVVAVANGQSFGKGMRIAPEARLDDGLLDVVAVQALPPGVLVRKLGRVYRGTHLGLPQVRWARGQEVQLELAPPCPPFDVDGECYPASPATLRLRAGALPLAAPPAA